MATNEQVKKTPFTGRTAEMKKESPWLASEDIEGLDKDVELTIKGVYKNDNVKTDSGRVENGLYSVAFEKTPKELILNSTNRQRIKRMYGPKTDAWVGKKIKLFVDPNVRQVGGGTGPGIRVREQK